MFGVYDLSAERTISDANYIKYNTGALHPDRVMSEHDLVYMKKGSWEVYQNDIAYTAKAGDVLLLHAGEHHYGLANCEEGTETLYLHMNRTESDMYIKDRENMFSIPVLTHCQNRHSVKRLFEDIINAFWTDMPIRGAKISAICQLLLCELIECRTRAAERSNTVDQALMMLNDNPQSFLTAAEIAKVCYVSERTLRNKFQAVHGKTLYQYQIDIKLGGVKLFLLQYPKMPLREIAASFGFYDEFHLSKSFKAKYGVSPSVYRRNTV